MREMVLVPVSLGLGMLLVWLLTARGISSEHNPFFLSVFWLCYLAVFYIWNWQKLRKNRMLWVAVALCASLCVWNFLHDYRSSYGALTAWVIPGVLMTHAVLTGGNHRWKAIGDIALDWCAGWIVRPFTAVHLFFGGVASALNRGKNSALKRVLLAVCATVPILIVVVPLLSSADMVFNYWLTNLLRGFSFPLLVGRLILAVLAAALFYSFWWNTCEAKHPEKATGSAKERRTVDPMIPWVALGTLLAVYLLFCTVQFTYLFAGAGLPQDITYSQYAREGFWQLIVVSGVNLLLFSLALQLCRPGKVLWSMLFALLVSTGVLLASALVRLGLYLGEYGLTWLRLLSGWFILYLAAVLLLCTARLMRENLPLVAASAYLLLAWYVALGYSNPDALIVRYNMAASGNPSVWVAEHRAYVRSLSDDGEIAAVHIAGVEAVYPVGVSKGPASGYSFVSHRLSTIYEEHQTARPT